MRYVDRIKAAVVLASVFSLAICLAVQPGCANQAGVAATQPVKTAAQARQELRLGSLIEARKAYSAAEDVITDALIGGAISHASGEQCRIYLRAARRSIDLAEGLLVGGSDEDFRGNLLLAAEAIGRATRSTSSGQAAGAATRSTSSGQAQPK